MKIKVQPAAAKPELETRKCHIVLDCSFVVPVFVGFLGVVVYFFVVSGSEQLVCVLVR